MAQQTEKTGLLGKLRKPFRSHSRTPSATGDDTISSVSSSEVGTANSSQELRKSSGAKKQTSESAGQSVIPEDVVKEAYHEGKRNYHGRKHASPSNSHVVMSTAGGTVLSTPPKIHRGPYKKDPSGDYTDKKKPTEVVRDSTDPSGASHENYIENQKPNYGNGTTVASGAGFFYDPKDTQGGTYGGNDTHDDATRAQLDKHPKLKTIPSAYQSQNEKSLENQQSSNGDDISKEAYAQGKEKGKLDSKTQETSDSKRSDKSLTGSDGKSENGKSDNGSINPEEEHAHNKSLYNAGGIAAITSNLNSKNNKSTHGAGTSASQNSYETPRGTSSVNDVNTSKSTSSKELGEDKSSKHGKEAGIAAAGTAAAIGGVAYNSSKAGSKDQSKDQSKTAATNESSRLDPAKKSTDGDNLTPISPSSKSFDYDTEMKKLDQKIATTDAEIAALNKNNDASIDKGKAANSPISQKSEGVKGAGVGAGIGAAVGAAIAGVGATTGFSKKDKDSSSQSSHPVVKEAYAQGVQSAAYEAGFGQGLTDNTSSEKTSSDGLDASGAKEKGDGDSSNSKSSYARQGVLGSFIGAATAMATGTLGFSSNDDNVSSKGAELSDQGHDRSELLKEDSYVSKSNDNIGFYSKDSKATNGSGATEGSSGAANTTGVAAASAGGLGATSKASADSSGLAIPEQDSTNTSEKTSQKSDESPSSSNSNTPSSSSPGKKTGILASLGAAAGYVGLRSSASSSTPNDSLIKETEAKYDDVAAAPAHKTTGDVLGEQDAQQSDGVQDVPGLQPSTEDSEGDESQKLKDSKNAKLEADVAQHNKKHNLKGDKSLLEAAAAAHSDVKEQPTHAVNKDGIDDAKTQVSKEVPLTSAIDGSSGGNSKESGALDESSKKKNFQGGDKSSKQVANDSAAKNESPSLSKSSSIYTDSASIEQDGKSTDDGAKKLGYGAMATGVGAAAAGGILSYVSGSRNKGDKGDSVGGSSPDKSSQDVSIGKGTQEKGVQDQASSDESKSKLGYGAVAAGAGAAAVGGVIKSVQGDKSSSSKPDEVVGKESSTPVDRSIGSPNSKEARPTHALEPAFKHDLAYSSAHANKRVSSGTAANTSTLSEKDLKAFYQAGVSKGAYEAGQVAATEDISLASSKSGKDANNSDLIVEVIGIEDRELASRVAQKTSKQLSSQGVDLSTGKLVIDTAVNKVYKSSDPEAVYPVDSDKHPENQAPGSTKGVDGAVLGSTAARPQREAPDSNEIQVAVKYIKDNKEATRIANDVVGQLKKYPSLLAKTKAIQVDSKTGVITDENGDKLPLVYPSSPSSKQKEPVAMPESNASRSTAGPYTGGATKDTSTGAATAGVASLGAVSAAAFAANGSKSNSNTAKKSPVSSTPHKSSPVSKTSYTSAKGDTSGVAGAGVAGAGVAGAGSLDPSNQQKKQGLPVEIKPVNASSSEDVSGILSERQKYVEQHPDQVPRGGKQLFLDVTTGDVSDYNGNKIPGLSFVPSSLSTRRSVDSGAFGSKVAGATTQERNASNGYQSSDLNMPGTFIV